MDKDIVRFLVRFWAFLSDRTHERIDNVAEAKYGTKVRFVVTSEVAPLSCQWFPAPAGLG